MRIRKVIDVGSHEVEIDIDGSDVVAAILGETEGWTSEQLIIRAFNNVAAFLQSVTDQQIEAMHPRTRELIHEFCMRQAERFNVASQGSE